VIYSRRFHPLTRFRNAGCDTRRLCESTTSNARFFLFFLLLTNTFLAATRYKT